MAQKAFRYRLYPTKNQARLLQSTLDECRWLYNHLLEERINRYEEAQVSISLYDQMKIFPRLKNEREPLKSVHSQVLQNVAVRVDLAFKAFFRRVKAKEKPGFPRFKGYNRYDSFTYPQSGFCVDEGKIFLSKIGHVKAKIHRPVQGTIKTCTIRRSSTGKWFCCFSVVYEPRTLPVSNESIGIDVGLESFATFSDGQKIEAPRFFRKREKQLAKVQRRLSKAVKGSKDRRKQRQKVARVHERIASARDNFVHQESRKLVDRYGFIAVEDIRVNQMIHNRCLTKSISDAAWQGFFACLTYKAEEAGRVVVAVNPAYTSQDCSRCHHRRRKSLSERVHSCECCGLVLDRDHNAALNILSLGMGQHTFGFNP